MELVGLTPIAAAAHQGHIETVKILYALGANAVIADSEDREVCACVELLLCWCWWSEESVE
eukprot:1100604-Rhodomonas_salina.1